jgi:exo-beta-1,3-glucanase (GH17 family)
MHGRVLIDQAMDVTKAHYASVSEEFPDKEIIFTEVGWTVKESDHMIAGQGSVENQKRYITELNEWIDKEEIVAFIFEAFDEPWKGITPEKGECNWGLFYLDRTKKW